MSPHSADRSQLLRRTHRESRMNTTHTGTHPSPDSGTPTARPQMEFPSAAELLFHTPEGQKIRLPPIQGNEALFAAAGKRPEVSLQQKMSEDFKRLIVQYCASRTDVLELESMTWQVLAVRLGTRAEMLQEAATEMGKDGSLWQEVLWERIKRVNATQAFRDANWQQLEGKTVAKLLYLVENNLIRDSGELIAIAANSRRANGNGTPPPPPAQGGGNVNVQMNFGASPVPEGELPPAGHKMTIDLSPRIAEAIERRRGPRDSVRVIDGEMLSAESLRGILQEHIDAKLQKNQPYDEPQKLLEGE